MELNNGIPIALQLKTEVQQEGETKEFFYELPGQLVRIGDTLYLRYLENLEGQTEAVPVTIKLQPDGRVQIIRSGENRMRLKFGYQEQNSTSYRTPMGLLPIETFTDELRVSLKERPWSGMIQIHYRLFVRQVKLGNYRLKLNFTA